MDRDLVDRRGRRCARAGDDDDEDHRPSRDRWSRRGGSPASDHDRARELVELAVAAFAEARAADSAPVPPSARPHRWTSRSGKARVKLVIVHRPSASRRDGVQPKAERNLRAYLLRALLDLTDAQIAAELGIGTPRAANYARKRGARLAPKCAGFL